MKITADAIKLFTSDETTHTATKKFCADNNLTGFTYTPKQDRYVKFCMYGLWEMPIDEVTAELNFKSISPVLIKQLTLKDKRYDGEAIYSLYFKRSQNVRLADLRNITGLFNVVTRFQFYKNKNKDPTQCSNCQQFGHGTQNCFRPAACVRCAGPHLSINCPLLPIDEDVERKIPDEKVKCVLCGEKHTANYRQCEARLKFKEKNLNKTAPPLSQPVSRTTTTRIINRRPALTQPSNRMSYAQAVKVDCGRQLLSSAECLEIYDLFVSELLKCRNVEE